MSSPSEQTLLITGANGFVAGHVVNEALKRGYHVRGTARSESSIAKAKAALGDDYPYLSRLSFAVLPDITKPELYEPAFSGTDKPIVGVINVAAPFALKVDNIARDLLDPAVDGAVAMLEATRRYGPNVRRLVNTSSFASILDPVQGTRPGYTYSEKDWNPMGYEAATKADDGAAYCASKALAERAIWDWVEREKPSFTVTAINPAWVFGPHVGPISDVKHLNESSAAIYNILNSKEVPPFDFGGFVDVRVLAAAHLDGFEKAEAAGERFLLGSHFDYQTAVDSLREALPQLQSRLPVGTPGSGLTMPVYQLDGSKAERVLGTKYISLGDCMRDSAVQLLAAEAS